MRHGPDDPPCTLERFRSYLHLLARLQLQGRPPARLDPSDVVQQTLLEAHRQRGQFRGQTDVERAAWLRQILAHNLADAARRLHRDKRDVRRERSLEKELEQSSAQLARISQMTRSFRHGVCAFSSENPAFPTTSC